MIREWEGFVRLEKSNPIQYVDILEVGEDERIRGGRLCVKLVSLVGQRKMPFYVSFQVGKDDVWAHYFHVHEFFTVGMERCSEAGEPCDPSFKKVRLYVTDGVAPWEYPKWTALLEIHCWVDVVKVEEPAPPTPPPPPEDNVRFYVFDGQTGKPMQGVKVVVKGVAGNVIDTKYTDVNGYVGFKLLLPGGYYADFTKDGYEPYSLAFTLVDEYEARIELKPVPGNIFVTVRMPDGTSPAGTEVRVYGTLLQNLIDTQYADESGRVQFTLWAGDYVIMAHKEGYTAAPVKFTYTGIGTKYYTINIFITQQTRKSVCCCIVTLLNHQIRGFFKGY